MKEDSMGWEGRVARDFPLYYFQKWKHINGQGRPINLAAIGFKPLITVISTIKGHNCIQYDH